MSAEQERRRWLLEQLPLLESQGVIDAPTRARLAGHYAAAAAAPARPGLALAISGVLGALLVGLGVILILAHNWESWTRPARTGIAFGALVAAQLLSLWVLWRRRASSAWCEAAATLQALAVAACIGLIGQTWHLYGDVAGFLLTVTLLCLPLVYLLGSSMVAVLAFGGIAAWCWDAEQPLAALAWFALLAPHVVQALRRDRHGRRAAWLGWAASLAAVATLQPMTGAATFDFTPLPHAGLLALLFLVDATAFDPQRPRLARPFGTVRLLGSIVLLLALATDDVLRDWHQGRLLGLGEWPGSVLSMVLLAGALAAWLNALRRSLPAHVAIAGALPLAIVVAAVAPEGVALVLLNLYALMLAVAYVRRGLREDRLGSLNLGLLLIAALIADHFLFSDLPYTVRGLAFLAVGAVFLSGNLWLHRQRRTA